MSARALAGVGVVFFDGRWLLLGVCVGGGECGAKGEKEDKGELRKNSVKVVYF